MDAFSSVGPICKWCRINSLVSPSRSRRGSKSVGVSALTDVGQRFAYPPLDLQHPYYEVPTGSRRIGFAPGLALRLGTSDPCRSHPSSQCAASRCRHSCQHRRAVLGWRALSLPAAAASPVPPVVADFNGRPESTPAARPRVCQRANGVNCCEPDASAGPHSGPAETSARGTCWNDRTERISRKS